MKRIIFKAFIRRSISDQVELRQGCFLVDLLVVYLYNSFLILKMIIKKQLFERGFYYDDNSKSVGHWRRSLPAADECELYEE